MAWIDRQLRSLNPLIFGFALLFASAAASALISNWQSGASRWVRHTFEVERQLNAIERLVLDAETGQRGYLLTGRQDYLEPYTVAKKEVPAALSNLVTEVLDNPAQTTDVPRLRALIEQKLEELTATIDLRAGGQGEEALKIVNNDSGERTMTSIRQLIGEMQDRESRTLEARSAQAARLSRIGQIALLSSILLVIGLGTYAILDGRKRLLQLVATNRRLELEARDRQTAEAQVRQLQKMEAIGQLTGGIAHDFNNMLAVVVGFLGLARRKLNAGRIDGVLQNVDHAADGAHRAVILTRRLLAFSRQQPLQPQVLSLNKLVGEMSELLRRTITESIELETVLAGGLWKVNADPAQVENAVINLAVNARDAMPAGGRLTIETANSDLDDRYAAAHNDVKAGQYVLISVTDTGEGMAPGVAERAFDPFYTTKPIGKGTGLGLSQVFGFVKQSGGHIKIYSEIERGTTVKIYLPRTFDAASSPGDTTTDAERHHGATDQALAKEVILVVEDEATVRLMTVASLRELGYTVLHESSPNAALHTLSTNPSIDLLFTDVVMPEMSGRDLVRHAQAQRPELKVLYTTGYTRNAVVHQGIVDPGTPFLPKPFTLTQLSAKMRQVLDAEAK